HPNRPFDERPHRRELRCELRRSLGIRDAALGPLLCVLPPRVNGARHSSDKAAHGAINGSEHDVLTVKAVVLRESVRSVVDGADEGTGHRSEGDAAPVDAVEGGLALVPSSEDENAAHIQLPNL